MSDVSSLPDMQRQPLQFGLAKFIQFLTVAGLWCGVAIVREDVAIGLDTYRDAVADDDALPCGQGYRGIRGVATIDGGLHDRHRRDGFDGGTQRRLVYGILPRRRPLVARPSFAPGGQTF